MNGLENIGELQEIQADDGGGQDGELQGGQTADRKCMNQSVRVFISSKINDKKRSKYMLRRSFKYLKQFLQRNSEQNINQATRLQEQAGS